MLTETHPHAQWRMFRGQEHTNIRAAPARIMIDGQSSQRYVPAAPPSGLAFTACQVQHARATVELTRHPCQQAAHFLPCARPPDRQFGRSQHYHRAFVTTSARTDNMPRQRDGDQPYSRTVLTRVEFEMLTRRSASRPRTPGSIHSEDHSLFPRFSPPSPTG